MCSRKNNGCRCSHFLFALFVYVRQTELANAPQGYETDYEIQILLRLIAFINSANDTLSDLIYTMDYYVKAEYPILGYNIFKGEYTMKVFVVFIIIAVIIAVLLVYNALWRAKDKMGKMTPSALEGLSEANAKPDQEDETNED